MMKQVNWSVIVVAAIFLLHGCGNDQQIIIEGTYDNAPEDEMLQLNWVNGASLELVDSAAVRPNGRFKIKFDLEQPELLTLQNRKGENLNLIAAPGDHISLEITNPGYRSNYSVEGSQASADVRTLVMQVEQSRQKLDSILEEINALEDPNSAEGKALSDQYMEVFKEQKMHNIAYIVEHLSSLASVYALYQRVAPDIYLFNDIKDLQYFKIVADSVRVKYPRSSLVRSLVSDVTARLEQYNNVISINRLTENNIVETGMVNLEIENPGGTPVSLRSLKGKVVLLQFWASWNEESRKANRQLKSIYSRYHNQGFEIYAVALDNDRNTWRRAIDFEEYPWINVSELTYPYSYAATVYNVPNIPANYLIDRDGNIVAKNITGSVLATWLDNLL